MKTATVKMKTVTVEMNVGWHEWSDPNDGPRPPAAQKHTTKNTQDYNWLQPPRIHKTTITLITQNYNHQEYTRLQLITTT